MVLPIIGGGKRPLMDTQELLNSFPSWFCQGFSFKLPGLDKRFFDTPDKWNLFFSL